MYKLFYMMIYYHKYTNIIYHYNRKQIKHSKKQVSALINIIKINKHKNYTYLIMRNNNKTKQIILFRFLKQIHNSYQYDNTSSY